MARLRSIDEAIEIREKEAKAMQIQGQVNAVNEDIEQLRIERAAIQTELDQIAG